MINDEYKEFVVPVFNEAEYGVGVFVGNYFITAGHVVKDNDTFVFFRGKKYPLKTDDAIAWRFTENESDENMRDYAVFSFEGINSPIQLSDATLSEDSSLEVISFKHDPGCDPINGDIKQITCKASFIRNLFSFCECRTDKPLHEGSSGSPLIQDGKVVGLLSGSLSSSHINYVIFQRTSYLKLSL